LSIVLKHKLSDQHCCTLFFQHLKQQQDGITHLISIIKEDLDDLKLVEQGLGVEVKVRRWTGLKKLLDNITEAFRRLSRNIWEYL